ncbi:MAG: hypothetical protein HZC22_10070 [Rhodocyclales bacterium]|nr:hypothetical protein [Rhodocyclales bacterium]
MLSAFLNPAALGNISLAPLTAAASVHLPTVGPQDHRLRGDMNPHILLCTALFMTLSGCGGPFGKSKPEGNLIAETDAGPHGDIETVTRNGVQYQIERSAGHPAISWAVGPNRLGAIMSNLADSVSYEDMHALQGHRYEFQKECKGSATVGDPKYGVDELPVTFRVFQYANKETMYVFRDVDMNGRKFRTYIVVASWQRPAGNYSHWIHQRTNDLGEVAYCKGSE